MRQVEEAEKLLELIRETGMKEYGCYPENLAVKINRVADLFARHTGKHLIAGALNNQDKEKMLLSFVEEESEKVIKGLQLLKEITGADGIVIWLPEEREDLKETLTDQVEQTGMKINIESGIADTRRIHRECIFHFETLAAVCDLSNGKDTKKTRLCFKICSPMGSTFSQYRDVFYGTKIRDITGYKCDKIKAVQLGNQLYDASGLEKTITQETQTGNGVITIYTADCCMIKAAETDLREYRELSCGKCTFCREGLGQIHARIGEITEKKGEWESLGIIKEIGEAMRSSCSCSVGETGAEFTLETIRIFENEYSDHIKKKKCTAGKCTAFVNVYIDPQRCTGCGSCMEVCPVSCIEGLPGYIYMIEDIDCIRCEKCSEVCDEQAVVFTGEMVPGLPDRLTRIGRFKRY